MTAIFRIIISPLLLAACLVWEPGLANAQERSKIKAADTSSPRDTLKSFIAACNEFHSLVRNDKFLDRSLPGHAHVAAQVLDCIDMTEIPAFAREHRATEVAVCIKEILDREELPPWEEVPDAAAIEAAGGLEKVSRWRIPGSRITIARVEEGERKHEYLFSKGTVARAVAYFNRIESEPYRTDGPPVSERLYEWYVSVPGHPAIAAIVQQLPEQVQRGRTFGLATWKWPGLLLTLLVAIGLMVAVYWLQRVITRRVHGKSVGWYCLTIVFPLGAMLVPLGFKHVAERHLTVRGNPLYYVSFLAILATIVAAFVVLFAAAKRPTDPYRFQIDKYGRGDVSLCCGRTISRYSHCDTPGQRRYRWYRYRVGSTRHVEKSLRDTHADGRQALSCRRENSLRQIRRGGGRHRFTIHQGSSAHRTPGDASERPTGRQRRREHRTPVVHSQECRDSRPAGYFL